MINVMMNKLKYTPTAGTTLSYFILLGINTLLILTRKRPGLQWAFLNDTFPEFYTHVSNFSISMLLLVVIGYIWILLGVSLKYILLVVATVMVINFIYELFIPLLNTPDIIDAWYGMVGSVVAGLYLCIIKKYGVKPFIPASDIADPSVK